MNSPTEDQIRSFRLRSHHLDRIYGRETLLEAAGACGLQNSPPGAWEAAIHNRIPELGGKELTIEELLTQPFFLTEQDNYRRVLNRRLAARRTILTPSLECGDTSLLIRMLEIDRGVSFLPWYAVENSVKEGRLIRLSVEDCYISLYRQIFSHKEKWRTREMDEFVRVAKLADEEE